VAWNPWPVPPLLLRRAKAPECVRESLEQHSNSSVGEASRTRLDTALMPRRSQGQVQPRTSTATSSHARLGVRRRTTKFALSTLRGEDERGLADPRDAHVRGPLASHAPCRRRGRTRRTGVLEQPWTLRRCLRLFVDRLGPDMSRFDDGGWASAEAANVHLAQRGCRAATGKSPGFEAYDVGRGRSIQGVPVERGRPCLGSASQRPGAGPTEADEGWRR
jgi:hypothetical protein